MPDSIMRGAAAADGVGGSLRCTHTGAREERMQRGGKGVQRHVGGPTPRRRALSRADQPAYTVGCMAQWCVEGAAAGGRAERGGDERGRPCRFPPPSTPQKNVCARPHKGRMRRAPRNVEA
jgi:hypothetical protein